MQGVDPWADAAPLEPTRYVDDEQPPVYQRGVYRQPDYRQPDFGRGPSGTQRWAGGETRIGPPIYDPPEGYGPPDGYGYDGYPPPRRRMSPLALAGTIAAVLISIGLVVAML